MAVLCNKRVNPWPVHREHHKPILRSSSTAVLTRLLLNRGPFKHVHVSSLFIASISTQLVAQVTTADKSAYFKLATALV